MKLTTKELLQIITILLKFIEKGGCHEVSFTPDDNFYQAISHEDRDFGGNPPIVIGSLNDDMESLKKILSGEYAPFAGDLERLGAVFTALGAVLTKKK